jgi:ribokinase
MAAELIAFGDISVDVAIDLPHLPRPDEKIRARWVGEYGGGMGANVASAFAALGGAAGLVAGVGTDDRGTRAMEDLRARGIDVRGVRLVDAPTFWTMALLDEHGEKSLVEFETDAVHVPWDWFDWTLADGVAAMHIVADTAPGVVTTLEHARTLGVITSLDLEPTVLTVAQQRRLLRSTNVLFCRTSVALSLGDDDDIVTAARSIVGLGPQIVAVTRGSAGCVVVDDQGQIVVVPGHAVDVVDTTGAGDCFAGAFMYAHLRSADLRSSAELANLMAAQSVTAYGSRGCLLSLPQAQALANELGLGMTLGDR